MASARIDAFATAARMLEALRGGELSALELLDLHLRRVERYNPTLNAIVSPSFETARAAAAQADAAHDGGALAGLPLTVKDSIDVEGLPSTAGISEFAGHYPPADGRLVSRLRRAGGIVFGKTNVPARLLDWQADNPIFGRTNNPWDLDRTPGGSTGGGAAALAAGLTPLEFGSDIGGSIRIPAAFCGVYGHKPSETALARSGHFPGSPRPNPGVVMAVQGPLSRGAADLELAMDVAAGPDAGEDVAWRLALPPARHGRLGDYRVAVMPSIDWLPVDDEIGQALERLASTLGRAGAAVREAQPRNFGDLRRHHHLYSTLLTFMTSVDQPEDARRALAEKMRAAGGDIERAQARGLELSAADYIASLGERELYRRAYREFFEDWDVLLAPITIAPPFEHTAEPWPMRALRINGRRTAYGLQSVYPAVATLSGQPATAFPVGLTRSGLPIGLQAIGPYLEDRTPIRFSALVAQEIGGFRAPPGYGS